MTDPRTAGQCTAMVESKPRLTAISGDRAEPHAEFRRLFDEHHGFVRRSLLGLGINPSVVDDACQEVFVVVHRRLDEFDGRTAFRSWLYGITRRVARTITRGEYRAARKRIALARAPRQQLDLDDELAARRAVELIERFLAKLSERQREVFVLSQIEGLSATEIADALDVKVNTVYSRLRLARRRFERFLARERAREGPNE